MDITTLLKYQYFTLLVLFLWHIFLCLEYINNLESGRVYLRYVHSFIQSPKYFDFLSYYTEYAQLHMYLLFCKLLFICILQNLVNDDVMDEESSEDDEDDAFAGNDSDSDSDEGDDEDEGVDSDDTELDSSDDDDDDDDSEEFIGGEFNEEVCEVNNRKHEFADFLHKT